MAAFPSMGRDYLFLPSVLWVCVPQTCLLWLTCSFPLRRVLLRDALSGLHCLLTTPDCPAHRTSLICKDWDKKMGSQVFCSVYLSPLSFPEHLTKQVSSSSPPRSLLWFWRMCSGGPYRIPIIFISWGNSSKWPLRLIKRLLFNSSY